jgi:hypothetical protein
VFCKERECNQKECTKNQRVGTPFCCSNFLNLPPSGPPPFLHIPHSLAPRPAIAAPTAKQKTSNNSVRKDKKKKKKKKKTEANGLMPSSSIQLSTDSRQYQQEEKTS